MTSSLGARLQDLRKRRGWSKADLARQLKLTRQAVGFYEDDERYPRHDILVRIAGLLQTPVGKLYTDTVPRAP